MMTDGESAIRDDRDDEEDGGVTHVPKNDGNHHELGGNVTG